MVEPCRYCRLETCLKTQCTIERCGLKLKQCCLQQSKYCINCAATIHAIGSENAFKILNDNYCQYCFKVKQVIGNRKLNGADHDDWDTRRFHKACYKKWIAEGKSISFK